jgi:HEAT repeat protein
LEEQEVSREEYHERSRTIRRLARDGNVDALIRELDSPLIYRTFKVRVDAVRALGKIRARAAVEPIARLLDDPVDRVRRFAIIALGRIGQPDAAITEQLLAISDDPEQDEGARTHAIAALAQLGARELIPRLRTLLASDSRYVRDAAFYAALMLGGQDAEEVVEPLTRGWKGRRRRRRVQRVVDRFNRKWRHVGSTG